MCFLLPWNLQGQAAELVDGAFRLAPRLLALASVHLHLRAACQTTESARGDLRDRLQIAQQRRRRGRGRGVLALPLHFQKQLWLVQNPLPDRS